MDIGMCDPTDDLFPPTLLGMSRWRHVPAPDVAENGPTDTNLERKARICKHLVHEHRRNTVRFPDRSEVRRWAI
eukprot:2190620-Pyramimonas_sp.AAC.1